jgi:Fanconi anemia group M protein
MTKLVNSEILIVADYREKESKIINELIKLGAKINFANLPVGDYLLSERLVVERKTFEDFANSIIDKRLFEQASYLRKYYEKPIIIIEGKGPIIRDISIEAIRGAMISLILDYGVPILMAENTEEAAKFIIALAKREGKKEELKTISLKDRRRKPKTLDEVREYVVASLPMIELKTAKKLLSFFGSIEKIFTASERALMMVDGIGPKKAKLIKTIVSGKYGSKSSSDVFSPLNQSKLKVS